MSIEPALIEYCSPTLASLKAGSLFNLLSISPAALRAELGALVNLLSEKGLSLRLISAGERRLLCYLYRASQLEAILRAPEISAFLRAQDYKRLDVHGALDTLCARLRQGGPFPHEIGLFLGYPLSDVVAFIENRGRNCPCCGCWKAYTNLRDARRQFDKLDKCRRVYKRLYASGRTLSQLTVANQITGRA